MQHGRALSSRKVLVLLKNRELVKCVQRAKEKVLSLDMVVWIRTEDATLWSL